jgi:hypothetical protein
MAQISLGESKWRLVRRALKKKAFTYSEVRNGTRFDHGHFEWLVKNEFFEPALGGKFAVTAKGKAAADLGFYEV